MIEIIKNLFSINYAGLVICLCFSIFLFTNNVVEKKIANLFQLAILTILILIITDFINEVYSNSNINVFWTRKLTAFIGYTLRPLVAFIVIIIALNPIEFAEKHLLFKNKTNFIIIISIPIIINGLVCFISCFTPLVFNYDINNVFSRGPLGFIPFVISGFYVCLMVILILIFYRSKNYGEGTIILLAALLCGISVLFESVYKMYGMLSTTLALGLNFYYLYMHTQTNKIDDLTKVLNNRSFWLDVKKFQHEKFALLSIDMNSLKAINDNFGHSAGNQALITLATIIKLTLPKKAFLYRIGGDEFAIIYIASNKEEVEELIKIIYQNLEGQNISIACGYAMYTPGEDFEAAFKNADQGMYDEKKRIKHEKIH